MFLDNDRQGTWQFLAAELINDPQINQTFIHDIESAFLILLWVSVCYLESTFNTANRSDFVDTIFNPRVYGSSGGMTKANFMASDEWSMPSFPKNGPLTNLLREMKFRLSFRYKKHPTELYHLSNPLLSATLQSQDVQGGASESWSLNKRLIQTYESFNEQLKDHNAMIECINNFLTCNGWPDTEPARKMEIALANEVKTALRSSSKRCRDAAEESEGGDARKRTSPK